MHTAAALVATTVLAALAVLQLGLALGAPWGRLVWGGQHAGRLVERCLHPRTRQLCPRISILVEDWRTIMCALQRTSGAKLSVSAAVPRGLALLADAPHGDLRRFSMPVTGPASP